MFRGLTVRREFAVPILIGFAGALGGCAAPKEDVTIAQPFTRPMTVAVAPILNFSGSFDLDPVRAADLLASELSYVEGVTVLPVNRVVAVLAGQGKTQVESPAHALAVAEAVGADAVLVAGITEYDAYTPAVGLVLQMYAPRYNEPPDFDPVSASRLSQPFAVSRMADPLIPTSQVQAVYDAAHAGVRSAVRQYALPRTSPESRLGWRQYLKVQTLYLRFCWHRAITSLMNQERTRAALLSGGTAGEVPT